MNPIAVDLAKKARARVAAGWVQGTLEDENGRVCAWGAMECAFDEIHDPGMIDHAVLTDAYSKNLTVLRRRVLGNRPIPNWNDAEGRTQEEVLAAFDELIEILEGEKY